MESSPKRRRLDHSGNAIPTTVTASPFVLQTEELLQEVKLDYEKAFDGVDGCLHKIRQTIDSMAPHDPIPVCLFPEPRATQI